MGAQGTGSVGAGTTVPPSPCGEGWGGLPGFSSPASTIAKTGQYPDLHSDCHHTPVDKNVTGIVTNR